MILEPSLPEGIQGTVVTVGTFDGVHKGHHAVLTEIAGRARASGLASMLVTFEPHPLEIVNPEAAPQLLTTSSERREILAQSELDYVTFIRFTHELSQFTPREFVTYLRKRLRMRELVIGYDHGLGRGRSGDVTVLKRLGERIGFEVDVVDAVTDHRKPVSSTLIRRAVAGGDLDTAKELLGRDYSVSGRVGRGDGRGKELGFPTLNVPVPEQSKLLPPDGVYAVTVESPLGILSGMLNQGPRPTFGDHERVLEVHVFDFAEDLYGAEVKIKWRSWIRDVEKFDGPAALKAQLERDAESARNALTHAQ